MTEQEPKTIILIDGHSLAYRSYFALERTGMRNSNNIPTWGVYGFFKAIFDLISKRKPDAIAMSFDVSKKTFRNDMYKEYKAHRPPMPDEMRIQLGLIRQGIESLNIPVYEQEGFEADDVIGTLTKRLSDEGHRVLILTGDQDSFQLIDNENIKVLLPQKGDLIEYDREKVYEKMGVYPEQLVDYKGLRGDSSDNIPGVRGIGEKTAVQLLSEYSSLEEIYENIDKIAKKAVKTKLIEQKDIAFLSKELAQICKDVKLDFDFQCCSLEIPNLDAFVRFLKEMEFRSFLKQLPTLFQSFVNYDSVDINVDGDQITIKFTDDQPVIETKKAVSQAEHERAEQDMSPVTASLVQDIFPADESGQGKLFDISQQEIDPIKETETITTQKQLDDLLQNLEQANYFSIDFETDSLKTMDAKMVGIALAWQPKETMIVKEGRLEVISKDFKCKAVYIPVGHEEGEQLDRTDVLKQLTSLLSDATKAKIFHHAKYDIHILKNYGLDVENIIMDTMLASYVKDSTVRHGLKELAMKKFHLLMEDYTAIAGTGKKQLTFDKLQINQVADYACKDAGITLCLAHRFVQELDETEQKLLYEMEIPLIEILTDMERFGMGLDKEFLGELSEELNNAIKEVEEKIYDQANYPEKFNINSTQQLGRVLFEHMGLPVGQKTKTGYSTAAGVLEKMAKNYDIAKDILNYRHLTKLKSTYVDALPKLINKKTGRIHTTFNQTGTSTGRLSSSDPNLQNIPIKTEIGNRIRKAFVPSDREEDLLLAADYSQIELRILADLSQEPNLVEAFKENKDIHTDTACKLFDIPESQVTKQQRRIAKAVNFGLIYGQSAYGLSETVDIEPRDAKIFIKKYFENFPKVKEYLDGSIVEAHEKGYAITKFGRKRHFESELKSRQRMVRENAERAAMNAPLQGTAADLIKLAMIDVYHRLKKEKFKARIALQVHDELVLEVPKTELEAVSTLVRESMEEIFALSVPLIVDVSTGANWMEAK
jgi:DNA polymerase-1